MAQPANPEHPSAQAPGCYVHVGLFPVSTIYN